MIGITFSLVLLAAINWSSSPEAAKERELQSAVFSNSLPDELKFSDGGTFNSVEEDLANLLAGADPDKRVTAARTLWEGHSRQHSQAVLRVVFGEPLKSNRFAALKRDVEDTLKPMAVMRELREGDFRWGAWLAFLRPHMDFVPLLLASLKDMPDYTAETMLALGKSGDRRALPPLLRLLKSGDYQTAGFAAQALGHLGASEVEPELIKALSDDQPWRQVNAASALTNLGTRRALPALERIVNGKGYIGVLDIQSAAMRAIVGIEKRNPSLDRRGRPTRELKLIATFIGHKDLVWNVAFSPDGKTLASVSNDGTVRLWDRVNGKNIVIFCANNCNMMHVAYSPDGQSLVVAGSGREVGGIRLLEVATGKTRATLRGFSDAINSLVISPNGKLCASSAASGKDKSVRLWDLASQKTVATLAGTSGALAFNPDGTMLATRDLKAREDVKLWDVKTRKVTITLPGHTSTVMTGAFSPDGRTLATGGDWTLRLWDVQTGKAIAVHRGDSDIYNVCFSPDGRLVAVGEVEGPVRLWETISGRFSVALRGRHPVAFSPDGKLLATGSEAGNTILLWEVTSEKN